jgi:NitT/TauT family transport system permease protein
MSFNFRKLEILNYRSLWSSITTVVVVLVIWQILSFWARSKLFPSAIETGSTLIALTRTGTLGEQIGPTLGRVMIGLAIGGTIGALTGLLMGSIAVVRRLIEPYVSFFRFVTPVVWIGPSIIWFGVGNKSMVFLIVYASIFIVLVNTMAGVGYLHRDRVRMARSFGADGWQVFAFVTVPSTVPFVLTGLRMAMGNSVMTAVTAEIVAGNNGIGYLIYSSRVYFEFDVMFASIGILGVLGFLFDRIFVAIQRVVFYRYRGADR